LTVVSFLPAHSKRHLHTKGRLHPVGHLLFFMVASALLAASARTARVRTILLVSLAGMAFAVEGLQYLLNPIEMEWHDVANDLLGVALGAILVALIGGMRGRSGAAAASDL